LTGSNLFLILASGEINGQGYWIIDTTLNESPTIDDKNLIECHRKELVGEESANNILIAIFLNIKNIKDDLIKEGFIIENPPQGISFSFPLNILENIFDFWLELYKDKNSWETCLGLLKIKKRNLLNDLISSGVLKGSAKEWAPIIQNLHTYRPESTRKQKKINQPMWK
tara:strand:- start:1298 stop:1804 length:507 start_codon:yes stop_codon:yes gene_type:complete